MQIIKSKLKWFLFILVAVILFIGFNYFRAQKLRHQRRIAMDEQRQVMIDAWKNQGLSQEQIDEKLKSERPNGLPDGKRPSGSINVLRMLTGGHPNRYRER